MIYVFGLFIQTNLNITVKIPPFVEDKEIWIGELEEHPSGKIIEKNNNSRKR